MRHILKFKKNIFSLGILDEIGCRYTVEGGVYKISQDAIIVMNGRK